MLNAVLYGTTTGALLIRAHRPPLVPIGRTGVGCARMREGHHDMAFGVAAIIQRQLLSVAHAFMIARKAKVSSAHGQSAIRPSRRYRRDQNGRQRKNSK